MHRHRMRFTRKDFINIACLFQKYFRNCWISLFRSVYIKFYFRTNERRIQYLRNAGAVMQLYCMGFAHKKWIVSGV